MTENNNVANGPSTTIKSTNLIEDVDSWCMCVYVQMLHDMRVLVYIEKSID